MFSLNICDLVSLLIVETSFLKDVIGDLLVGLFFEPYSVMAHSIVDASIASRKSHGCVKRSTETYLTLRS